MTGHVARIGERRGACRVVVGKPEGKNHFQDLGIDEKIILQWIFKEHDWGGGA
jgi:hypothetical protein